MNAYRDVLGSHKTLNRAVPASNGRPCFVTCVERNSWSGACVKTGNDLSGVWHKRLYNQMSHELACHFIAPRAANVTIAAQWRVSQPPKHAPVAGRLSIRQRRSHWRGSPVQRVARKY